MCHGRTCSVPTPSHLSSLCPASLWTLRASALESNLADFLAPEICLLEQDFTVTVTFPGGLPSRSQPYKGKRT